MRNLIQRVIFSLLILSICYGDQISDEEERDQKSGIIYAPPTGQPANPRYNIGFRNRTESMSVRLIPDNLDGGTVTNQKSRDYAHLMGRANDDAGHILAKNLGGSGTDLRNIFPQTLNINRGIWRQRESEIADWLKAAKNTKSSEVQYADYNVTLHYDNSSATRPSTLDYRVEFKGLLKKDGFWGSMTN